MQEGNKRKDHTLWGDITDVVDTSCLSPGRIGIDIEYSPKGDCINEFLLEEFEGCELRVVAPDGSVRFPVVTGRRPGKYEDGTKQIITWRHDWYEDYPGEPGSGYLGCDLTEMQVKLIRFENLE